MERVCIGMVLLFTIFTVLALIALQFTDFKILGSDIGEGFKFKLPDEFTTAFGRHVLAAHRLTQTVLSGMKESGYGRIINIISTSVYEPIPNLGVSNTIRGAMASWSKTVSKELPPGITINNVLPGFTDTERLGQLKKGRANKNGISEDTVHQQWLSQVPEGRLAQPEETASAIGFLVSPAAGYIRGLSLPVDGGRLKGI